jgi:hypothetical protein
MFQISNVGHIRPRKVKCVEQLLQLLTEHEQRALNQSYSAINSPLNNIRYRTPSSHNVNRI